MSHENGRGCRDDCDACNNPLIGAVYVARRVCVPVAVAAAILATTWGTAWALVWIAAGAWIGITVGLWAPAPVLMFKIWRRRREIEKQRARLRELQQEKIQLDILHAQRQTQIAALGAEKLELERMLAQRKLEQEARGARQRLDIACAAIEADRLEAAAWRMELTAKELELKLGQADLFESLSAIEDNAQDRIIAAYEQGVEHGRRGIVIPPKYLRHLRVVDESA